MNYKHIYLEVIRKAKNEQLNGNRPLNGYYKHRDFKDEYFEFHHILPKSIFPKFKNIKKNLVPLTAREHFICHKLLLKIYPSREMAYALICLCNKRKDLEQNIINSKEYEKIRKIVSKYQSDFLKGHIVSNEQRIKISNTIKNLYETGILHSHNEGNSLSNETKEKISNKLKEKYKNGNIEVWNKNKSCPSSIKLKDKNGMYKKHWFTNGTENIISEICPDGFKPGASFSIDKEKEISRKQKIADKSKNRHWYNNGIINKFCYECPNGFVNGFLNKRWSK